MAFQAPDDETIFLTPVQSSITTAPRFHQHDNEIEEVDERGDAIFRFRLDPQTFQHELTLAEFYRTQLQDLLKIVKFYQQGAPVIVDGFAFLNDAENVLSILDDRQPE